MARTTVLSLLCLAVLAAGSPVQGFDFASYKPGDLDEVLAMPKPKTGVDVISLQKLALNVTLESYAQKCGLAGVIKFSMSMLPTVYPREFVNALSGSKCVKVKSLKGTTVSLAIQDKVAEFLPQEVPLGSRMTAYCVLVCMTADGPGLIVAEFQTRKAAIDEQSRWVARLGTPQ